MRFVTILILAILLLICGCAQVAPQIIKFDEEYHQAILSVARTRIKYVSCDIGLIDGLGIASSADFPIMSGDQARAILQNPGISIALGEVKQIAKVTMDENGIAYWKPRDYSECKVLGLGYRVAALSVIDIVKLFPALAPYLAVFGPK